MDITKTNDKLITSKFFNGETVNYSICYFAVTLIFLFIKQLLKISFGVKASVAVLVSFLIGAAVLYLLEKKYVFIYKVKTNTPMQLGLTALRCGVDLGFFKLCDFIFGTILNTTTALVYVITWSALLFFNYYFDRLLVFDCRSNPLFRRNGRAFRLFVENRFVLLSAFVAMLGLGFSYMVFKVFPLGDGTVLRMDLYHQYGPLYCELYDKVANHESFIYSWVSGGGTSFLGNYFNYLSSPLSFIILLFERKEMPYAITTMVMVKCVLSAASFTYYLKKSQNSHSYASAAFGVFYAFSAYFLAYYWNIMWLDGMILFPIIILGIERIIDERKPLTYIASLTVLLYSTYYIGYMTCIFSIVYFIAYFFISMKSADEAMPTPAPEKKTDGKKKITFSLDPLRNNRFISRGVTFAFASLLSGMLCAVTLIPVYFILQSSSATSDTFPSAMETYFDLINLVSSHLAGLTTTIRSSGDDVLPNIYCGILPAILLPLYIMNKKISIKEKTVYVLLIILFVFSFDTNMANFVWHAMHFPNDLPYRFSFMYSFIFLVMAYKALKHIRAISYRDIALIGFVWIALVLFYEKFPTEKITDFTIFGSIGIIMVWTAVLLLIKKGLMPKFVLGVTIISIAFCEVIIADTQAYSFNRDYDEYVSNYDTYRDTISYVENEDKSFYRQELCYLDTRMDPCLYGYDGMSVFSSMAYEDYSGLQYSLGLFGNRINSYTYNTQTPVYNMMFNLKYLTQKDTSITPSKDFYTHIYTSDNGKGNVFKNNYYLPISFVASSDIKKWDCTEGDPFEVQEDFIDKAAGVSDVFIPCEYVATEAYGADCEDVTENGVYSFSKDEDSDGGTIDVTIKAVNNSNLYVYIYSPEIDNVNYFWNDEEDTTDQYIDEPYIMDLGKHKKGDKIRIELSLASMETDASVVDIYAYNIDKKVFEAAYDMLKAGAMNVTSHTATTIEGTVDAGYSGYLYTSIPYDEGWSVYIDGEKVKTFKVGDCMLATGIKQGKHTVKYKYSPKGLNYGFVITGATWLCILVYGLYRILVEKGKKTRVQNNNTVDI